MLLKKRQNLLPLDKNTIKSVAVIGPLADSVHLGLVRRHAGCKVTPLAGITAEVGPNVKSNYAGKQAGDAAINAARHSTLPLL